MSKSGKLNGKALLIQALLVNHNGIHRHKLSESTRAGHDTRLRDSDAHTKSLKLALHSKWQSSTTHFSDIRRYCVAFPVEEHMGMT
ncbi:hypothetical protein BOTNAR_0003g00860 [Botryotinia narcissicola]|uniref:Uncharacterized protein n=1 Tax=Botryotinia narcissicola TaxID=278944 RepID=A0A4Z1JFT4_9HELO|nr:hypothetical protein BOTNAR_0003g00860 [Botryotinia narcissicola]